MIHYYLTISPMEALVASQLDAAAFGSYMATGSRKGAAEQLMFIEVTGGFGDWFDWGFAEERCVAHADGEPKHSLYLSIYRTLEHVPTSMMGSLHLVTKDGRSLELQRGSYVHPQGWQGYALYKELCPVSPLVASSLLPDAFGAYLVSSTDKVTVPALVFADIRIIDLDDLEHSGNIGTMYDRKLDHLKDCIGAVQAGEGKKTKTVDRSFSSKFTYQTIASGIYVATQEGMLFYAMPDSETLARHHYDWARSANIF